ncbi:HAD-IIIC family phosphatase [Flagellimonas meridianipacifica]|uniref:HAD superfamily phosphatase (TIGR01681 family)/FkbH-like protein n=1 Tax=Flagellimonas meridianipacifica TaxID=1080225 RepID=A0A2T0MCT2_9FLAO|nr:HAD-IIIC family phosphatase [Allomuricauda pacifica]PRX55305.1 HAD superfamily phosphatase (TIGR01681 family)/FkbH-like protein [Allomuricauda pacifica]
MKNFIQLKKNLKKDFTDLRDIKVALLGDTATQFLKQALKGLGHDYGIHLNIWEADFNQIERQVLDPSSELYAFEPEIVILFQSSHKLLSKYNKTTSDQHLSFAENQINAIEDLYANITDNIKAEIIYYNYPEIDDSVFGNYANKAESSFLFQLRKLNYELMLLAAKKPSLFLCDLSSIQNQIGKASLFNPSVYINTEMVLGIDALPQIAARTISIINGLKGKIKKCLILDLDNTTWGGIIGDDGIENIEVGSLGIGKAFSEFQQWVKKLKNRGIIIAVCSKNTESVAKEPFEKHPEMVLRLEDISVFVANWENKADNIRQIQQILNIGFDSMVFLDDNPFERNIVRENLPDVLVPELPEDPANYLEYLYGLNLFETTSFSGEDAKRTKLYQIEAERVKAHKKFTNEDDFLKNLAMTSKVEPFTPFNTPRIAQLSQRSNQFNLRTVRYSESDVEQMANSEDYATFSFTLEDRFGDNGLICAIILQKEDPKTWFIDTWFMSCRVLKRGMENFVLNTIVTFAKENNFDFLKGEYIPTPKNKLVENHYKDLGFEYQKPYYILDVNEYADKKSHITKQETK